jgi:D-arabinose 1-dehydrogenase-like Zn-dependent alcohol dehydrogenase
MQAAVLRKYDAPLVIQEVDIPAIGPKGLRIIGCRASIRRDLAEVISWVEEKKILPLM